MNLVAARVGFGLAFATCLVTLWTLCHLVHLLGGCLGLRTKRERHAVCVMLSQKCFRYLMLAPCPWVNLVGVRELEEGFREAAQGGTPYVLANHNSMADSLLVTALIPADISRNMRSLIKLALFSEPLFGYICTAVGHFPVFFKGSKDGDFSVDREAQAKVTAELDEFIEDNGGLVIFPEGQLNQRPRQLQPFRRGAFALPMKHSKPIWGFLNVGCDRMWPKGQPIGGIPGDIHVKIFKVCDDASTFEDAATLADHAQRVMQLELDHMYATVDEAAASKKDA